MTVQTEVTFKKIRYISDLVPYMQVIEVAFEKKTDLCHSDRHKVIRNESQRGKKEGFEAHLPAV